MGGQADLILAGNFLSAVVQNTANILASRYTPKKKGSALRITLALGTAAQFGVTVSDGVVTTPLMYFENGAVLTANRVYTWTIGARSDYSYQFQANQSSLTPVKIQYLTIEEVPSGEL